MNKLAIAFMLAMIAPGCLPSEPARGIEGNRCYGNGTCNDGLTCLSGYCVRLPGQDDGSSTDGDADASPPRDEGREATDEPPTSDMEEAVAPDLVEATDEPPAEEIPDTGTVDDGGSEDVCTADCTGRLCGDDGCGGSCGSCPSDVACIEGQCADPRCPSGFVAIPAGRFSMGAPEGQSAREANELLHEVTLTRSFCLKRTEVTRREFTAVGGYDPSSTNVAGCADDCPVDRVNWWAAVNWLNRASQQEGRTACYQLTGCTGDKTPEFACTDATFLGLDCDGYRLPTEAEWEYAARAGTTTNTYNGDVTWETLYCDSPNAVLDPIAWFCGNKSVVRHPVARLRPNAWGLYDMLGSVTEWVCDRYARFGGGPKTDPLGPVE